MRYLVYISTAYFPKGTQPKENEGTDVWESTCVIAESRTEAAQKAWEQKGMAWLEKMNPIQTSVRKVSLNVNDPMAGTSGVSGRLPPIKVYEDRNSPLLSGGDSAIACIKQVLAGDPVMDIAEEWGEGRLDKEPILQQDKPNHKNDQYPQFLAGDGMSAEPSNKDPIEEF